MTTPAQDWRQLPLRRQAVWQGGIVALRSWVRTEQGEQFQPLVPLWLADDDADAPLHLGTAVRPQEVSVDLAVDALSELAAGKSGLGYLPGRIDVDHGELAERLRSLLANRGVDVQLVEHIPAFDEILDELDEFAKRADCKDFKLPDVDDDVLREFAQAASEYYQAEPWQYVIDLDIIRILKPAVNAAMRYICVMGAAGHMFGLAFYATLEQVFEQLRGERFSPDSGGNPRRIWQLTFNAPEELPPSYYAAWRQANLPVADGPAIPLFIGITPGSPAQTAGPREVQDAICMLRALAQTTDSDIEGKTWGKQVRVGTREVEVALAVPDLVNPPSVQDWAERGLLMDRRAMERSLADIGRYFDAHPPNSPEEARSVLASRFSGPQAAGRLVTKPRTAAEQAQDLCYQAFETYGRRRVTLARRALELDSDCADAYVILAEQSGRPLDRLRLSVDAVAAGRRAIEAGRIDLDGPIWTRIETRPFLRALYESAVALDHLGEYGHAIEMLQELLSLDTDDHLGARYRLLTNLLLADRIAEAARLLNQYPEDTPIAAFGRAIVNFRRYGASAATRRALVDAIHSCPGALEMLVDPHLAGFAEFESDDPLAELSLSVVDVFAPVFKADPQLGESLIRIVDGQPSDRPSDRRSRNAKVKRKQKKKKRR